MPCQHPLFDEIDAALADLVPREPVAFRGEWTRSTRRKYRDGSQLGTGSGPFVEIVDWRWRGALESLTPIAGLAFFVTMDALYWGKSAPASLIQPVEVSFAAYADYSPQRASFSANLGNAYLPGVAIDALADPVSTCTLASAPPTTGKITCLAQVDEAAFLALLVPGRFLRVGRNRLWRLRERFAATLPSNLQLLFTRRRSGTFPREKPPG